MQCWLLMFVPYILTVGTSPHSLEQAAIALGVCGVAFTAFAWLNHALRADSQSRPVDGSAREHWCWSCDGGHGGCGEIAMKIAKLHSSKERETLSKRVACHRSMQVRLTITKWIFIFARWANPERARACCSLWWKKVPPFAAHKVGVIGHYASTDDAPAWALLDAALDSLRRHDCTVAIGPMDGNTWRHYRFATELGAEPPFFLEPANPPAWPLQFERALQAARRIFLRT